MFGERVVVKWRTSAAIGCRCSGVQQVGSGRDGSTRLCSASVVVLVAAEMRSGQKATSLQAAVTSAARNCEVGTVHCERSRRMKGLERSTRLAERLVEGIEVR